MRDELELMLSMQDGVNSVIDGDWRERGNEWYRAVWMECAEMLDREGDWKWWKAPLKLEDEDARRQHAEQQQIELVDIWHFVLSWALEEGLSAAELEALLREPRVEANRHRVVETIVLHAVSRQLPHLVRAFANACDCYALDFENLFKLYVAKNVVNRFRQERGYKTGEYRKVFDGKEDNEHLAEILGELNDVVSINLPDTLYDRLAERYESSSG